MRFALPCYRPRYIPATYLVTDPTQARDAGAAEARFAYCALLCLVYGPRYMWPSHYLPQTQPQPGPATPLFAVVIAAIKLELQRVALRTSLCFASLQTPLHSRYIPRYRPGQPGPASPLFAAAWLALSSAAGARFAYCALRTALCFASLQTSLRSRHMPRYRPNPSPGPRSPFCRRLACVDSCNQAGAAEARFAYCAWLCLVTDLGPTPARAREPPFCRRLACVE